MFVIRTNVAFVEKFASQVRHQQVAQRQKRKALVKAEYETRRHENNLDFTKASPPLRQYLIFCTLCDSIASSSVFNNYILVCIIVAGFLVGVETFVTLAESPVTIVLGDIILYSFCSEVILKIIGEGKAPILYFIGPEWKWNTFDFFIVMFSLPILPVSTSQLKILRLIRLMRLAKVFRKIPQLQMIIMGLAGGMESVLYISTLLFLVFYMFAIAGMIFFKDNNPWHWKSLEISLMTLLRVATLDDWGNIFYIDYYGCDVYSAGGYYYTNQPAVNLFGQTGRLGTLPAYCNNPTPQPAFAMIFYIGFIMLCSFCMLSLFIGAISTAMAASIEEQKEKEKEAQVKKEREMLDQQIEIYKKYDVMDRKMKRRAGLITSAFAGEPLVFEYESVHASWGNPKSIYKWLSLQCQVVADSSGFQNIVTLVIVIAGVLVGIDCDADMQRAIEEYSAIADVVIQTVFAIECIVKIVAEEFKPWKYFIDNWNKFDFFVVVAAYVFTYGIKSKGSLIMILRLLRLLRVLKLMRALPQLQVIVGALMEGVSSIGFISILLVIVFYFFAIIGMTLFSTNDPWHFTNLWVTLFTLIDAATLDGWSSMMYVDSYGCAQVAGDGPCTPENDHPQFVLSFLYWGCVVFICAFVMLTLFIGVVSMGMEESKSKQDKQKKIDDRAKLVAGHEGISDSDVDLYKEVFDLIDFTGSMLIGKHEMKFGLGVAGIVLEDNEFMQLWRKVDKDDSNEIDFAEFLELMMDLRRQLQSKNKKGHIDNWADNKYDFVAKARGEGSFIIENEAPGEGDVGGEEDPVVEKNSSMVAPRLPALPMKLKRNKVVPASVEMITEEDQERPQAHEHDKVKKPAVAPREDDTMRTDMDYSLSLQDEDKPSIRAKVAAVSARGVDGGADKMRVRGAGADLGLGPNDLPSSDMFFSMAPIKHKPKSNSNIADVTGRWDDMPAAYHLEGPGGPVMGPPGFGWPPFMPSMPYPHPHPHPQMMATQDAAVSGFLRYPTSPVKGFNGASDGARTGAGAVPGPNPYAFPYPYPYPPMFYPPYGAPFGSPYAPFMNPGGPEQQEQQQQQVEAGSRVGGSSNQSDDLDAALDPESSPVAMRRHKQPPPIDVDGDGEGLDPTSGGFNYSHPPYFPSPFMMGFGGPFAPPPFANPYASLSQPGEPGHAGPDGEGNGREGSAGRPGPGPGWPSSKYGVPPAAYPYMQPAPNLFGPQAAAKVIPRRRGGPRAPRRVEVSEGAADSPEGKQQQQQQHSPAGSATSGGKKPRKSRICSV